MSKQQTIGELLARMKKQGLSEEQIMETKISICMRDPHGNNEYSVVYDDYPRLFGPYPNDNSREIRLQGYAKVSFRKPRKEGV